MAQVIPLLLGILTASLIQAGFFWFITRRQLGRTNSRLKQSILELQELESTLRANLIASDSAISVESYSFLETGRESLKDQIERVDEERMQIIEKLQTQRAAVEELELAQQAVKTTRQEDEVALKDVQEQFEVVREEASLLEQQVAVSQQQLEEMLQRVELTKVQRDYLENLQESMRSASKALRQLLDEYADVEERLTTVTKQQHDLELEYTALVEKLLS